MKTKQVLILVLLALATLNSELSTVKAQGTAFTYQSQLSSNGVPLNGNYDFQFSLYPNAAGAGSPLGASPITQTAIGVTNGLFTTTLNFGAVFTGNATWLAISVRSNNVGSYTALKPLQELSPTPYAIYTPNAGSAATATTAGTASSVAAANITGTVALAQLPAAVVTTNEPFVTLNNLTLSGGLTVNSSALSLGGGNNMFIGSLFPQSVTGSANIGLGLAALNSETSGSQNIAVGEAALQFNMSGSNNTAIGVATLQYNISGNSNTAMGPFALYQDPGSDNTVVGAGALQNATSANGNGNTALGVDALLNLESGSSNIALGALAGQNFAGNETGNIDIGNGGSPGENNIIRIGANQTTAYIAGVITGNGAGLTGLSLPAAVVTTNEPFVTLNNLTLSGGLTVNSSALSLGGGNNMFIGSSFPQSVTGSANIGLGLAALNSETSGSQNIAVGEGALQFNMSGSNNTAIGVATLQYNISGNSNTAMGPFALYQDPGSDNTVVGAGALQNATSANGNGNTALGVDALLNLESGSSNIALGALAGQNFAGNETGNIDIGNGGSPGENNIIRIGANQTTAYIAGVITGNGGGLTNLIAANIKSGGTLPAISGANLTNLNAMQLSFSPSGAGNFFLGTGGNATTTGQFNTAGGLNALAGNTTGSDNTAYGSGVLHLNTTGSNNTAIGLNALHVNTTGSNNTANGSGALQSLAGGTNNTALGYNAGSAYTANETSNIDIGNLGVAGENNVIRIGASQTTAYMAGISGATVASGVEVFVNSSGQLGTATSSARFKQDIQGMDDASDVLLALHPVKFKYKPELDPQGIPQFGLVAEEVDKVDPDLVARDNQGKINTVRYNAVNAMLLNEFLKQHRKVQEQSAEIQDLKQSVAELKKMVQMLAERK